MTDLPNSKSCFACGSRNPIGLRLRFRTDGRVAETIFTPRPEHNGFVNVMHGGLVATVLDEVMVWGCGVSTHLFSYCAEMTVRYHAPVRPMETLRGVGELVENKRGRLFVAKGELFDAAGQLLASSTGKYMPVRDIGFASLLQDFEGTPEQLEAFFGPPGSSSAGAAQR
jgi:uncharacterized protein (TIGR00369 family)